MRAMERFYAMPCFVKRVEAEKKQRKIRIRSFLSFFLSTVNRWKRKSFFLRPNESYICL